ncbi:TPA: ABC transporter ATP-binding protein [Candidatus Poribacteria bacterium]|nr:ABC transporter ATP-binding protein [Candidatus Poribacteria bacterium]
MKNNNEIVISVNSLTKKFDDITAVDNINLQIYKGESFALLGPDGAGKTTALRLLCGILLPDSGDIYIKNINIVKHAEKSRDQIGYMPQRFSLYENLSVIQNINFFSELYNVEKAIRQKRIREYLDSSRLTPFSNRLARQLSGGMRQKLALICSIIHNPPILLLDEPTTGVDPVSRRDFWKILHRLLASGVTLVISTPYMDEAERCSRIGLIHNGRILVVDSPNELKKKITGKVMEIKCDEPHIVSEVVKTAKSVISTQTYSDKLRILLNKGADEQETISLLKSKGVNFTDIREVLPNVEDIFISRLTK